MPLRSVKMNLFIFGFHRRVWCPKCTPLSSSCFMVTTAIAVRPPSALGYGRSRMAPAPDAPRRATPVPPSGHRTERRTSARAGWCGGRACEIGSDEPPPASVRGCLPRCPGSRRRSRLDPQLCVALAPSPESRRPLSPGRAARDAADMPQSRRAAPVAGLVTAPVAAGLFLLAALPTAADVPSPRWRSPLDGPRVAREFAPPAAPYGPGHRGVDLAAPRGSPVRAAGDGMIGYSGWLAGRPVVSVVHGELRTTYEPVVPALPIGARVAAGDVIGHLAEAPTTVPVPTSRACTGDSAAARSTWTRGRCCGPRCGCSPWTDRPRRRPSALRSRARQPPRRRLPRRRCSRPLLRSGPAAVAPAPGVSLSPDDSARAPASRLAHPALLAPLGAAVVAVGSTVARRSRSRGMPPPTGPPLASKVIDLAGERVRRATVPTVNRRDAGGGLG